MAPFGADSGFEPRIQLPLVLTSPIVLETLSDEIVLLSARIQSATYDLLTLIREFDQREGWGCGFTSRAHWTVVISRVASLAPTATNAGLSTWWASLAPVTFKVTVTRYWTT